MYLDYQATTPVDFRVHDKMLPYMQDTFGNPHSGSHMHGWIATDGVEVAREQIAKAINASPKEIFFTSGTTESNNLALEGMAKYYKGPNKFHVITTKTVRKQNESLLAEVVYSL